MPNSPTVPSTTTPPADGDTADVWRDGQPFDGPRAMKTITAMRTSEQAQKGQIKALRAAIGALVAGGNLTDAARSAIAGAVPPAPDAATDTTLTTIAGILGADATDPAAMIEQATQARLSGELYGIMVEAHADPKLTRAVLNDSRALVSIDLSADDVHEQLTAVVADALKAHPNLKLRNQSPSVAGVPFSAGSGGSPTQITREALAWLKPEQVQALRLSGDLEHLQVGKG